VTEAPVQNGPQATGSSRSRQQGSTPYHTILHTLRASERLSWWTIFALVALLGAAWVLASPPTAAPDEPSHVVTAVAVAHGQLLGSPLTPVEHRALSRGIGPRGEPVRYGQVSAYRSVTVPKIYGDVNAGCYAFRREVPANCLSFRGHTPTGAS
jgi:hypothetical protein